jgi:hypothetical protein
VPTLEGNVMSGDVTAGQEVGNQDRSANEARAGCDAVAGELVERKPSWREKALQVPLSDSIISSVVFTAECGSLVSLRGMLGRYKPMLEHRENPAPAVEFVKEARSLLERWEAVEARHGKGSVMSLEHPHIQRLIANDGPVKFVTADEIANAERFRQTPDYALTAQLPESFRKFREQYPSR